MSIGVAILLLFGLFFVLLFLGCPISIGLVVASLFTALTVQPWGSICPLIMKKMNGGVENFSLLAFPLFILAGNLMNNGGIANRLVSFAKLFVGRIPGSLAHANVVGNMLFGSLSGSSVAACSAMGGCIYPIQKREGYDPAFAASVNIASAPSGMLIPPSNGFIIYATVVGGTSISALFMAGYVPGILMGLGTMLVAYIYAKRHNYKVSGGQPLSVWIKTSFDAIPSLLMIVVVIGGIVGGVFTATEAAGVSVLYCLLLSLCYRSINLKSFIKILVDSAVISAVILFSISASTAMSYVMVRTGIPGAISKAILSVSDNMIVILLLINVLLLVIGMFMDMTPAILIFVPIFWPIVHSFGMTSIQFGTMLIYNLCIGAMTPPVGSVLFVGCGITKLKIEQVSKMLLPYFLMLIMILLLITYIPSLSEALPRALGLMG